MSSTNVVQAIILLVDLMMPITLLAVWIALRKARRDGPDGIVLALPIIAAAIWGALWAWWPPLAAARLQPPPFGQSMPILSSIIAMISLLWLPGVRRFFASADPVRLVALGPWRIVYGLALLALGTLNALPPAFFWSAAAGDIAIGLWALAIMARGSSVPQREVTWWNGLGLADLLHVLALGATNLPGFYAAHPAIAPLNLLPLVGVPVFIAVHIMTLWGLLGNCESRQTTARSVT